MSSFSIVLVLVSFQVFCDGAHAPGRVGYPLHRRSGFPLVRPGEFRVEKRTGKNLLNLLTYFFKLTPSISPPSKQPHLSGKQILIILPPSLIASCL